MDTLRKGEQVWNELLVAFGLMLILEGMMPFLYPNRWKALVRKLAEIETQTMRMMGFMSMLIGLILLYWIR